MNNYHLRKQIITKYKLSFGRVHAPSSDLLNYCSGALHYQLIRGTRPKVVQSIDWSGRRLVNGTRRRVIDRSGRRTFEWSLRGPFDRASL